MVSKIILIGRQRTKVCKKKDAKKANMIRRKLWARSSTSKRDLMELCKDQQHLEKALRMACLMDQQGRPIPRDIIYCLLQQCTNRKDLEAARQVHFLMINNKLDSVPVLADHLIRLFALCGSLLEACQAFYKVVKPTVFTWNAIISAHTKLGRSHRALVLYASMQQHDVTEDKVTFLSIIKACANPGGIKHGRHIHDRIIRSGLDLDVMVGNTLVDMYAKCQSIDEARRVFDRLPDRSVISWSSMIKGHAQHGQGLHALELFEKMQEKSLIPDKVLLSCILQACSTIGAVKQGRLVHHMLVEHGNESDTVIGSTLLDMYVKCGGHDEACKVFECVPDRDVVVWGTMIAGYACYGDVEMALACLKDMLQQGLEPDEMIVTSILSVCSQAGLLEEGHKYFNSMEKYHGITRSVEHYNGMVDLLCRSGSLDEASYLLQTMPVSPDVIGWRCLLAGCRLYGHTDLARYCFNEVVRLNSSDASAYVLMTDVYAKAGMWEDVYRLQELSRSAAAPNKPGKP